MSHSLTWATAIAMAFASAALSACGPDDNAASLAARNESAQNASPAPAVATSAGADANEVSATAPVPSATTETAGQSAAVQNAVQSVQTSLAADSKQVAPVMSYAPGDGGDATRNP